MFSILLGYIVHQNVLKKIPMSSGRPRLGSFDSQSRSAKEEALNDLLADVLLPPPLEADGDTAEKTLTDQLQGWCNDTL